MRRWVAVGVLAVGLAAAAGVVLHRSMRWKRFHVVEPGVLYRSGLLTDGQLREAVRRHGIKTVFSFTFTNDAAERRVCQELGVRRHFHYLAGNGVGPDEPYLRFLEVASDPENQPVLVHCTAGVQRTGGACVLFRTKVHGWDFERAAREMLVAGNDGNEPQLAQLRRLYEQLGPPRPIHAVARAAGRGTVR